AVLLLGLYLHKAQIMALVVLLVLLHILVHMDSALPEFQALSCITGWRVRKMSYVTINMQEIAEYQHGPGAKAVCTGDHAYHWRALLPNGLTAGMDLQAFADKKY